MVAQIKLSTGATIPQLGFGSWQASEEEVETAIYEAIKTGYRHLDLAKVYQNQKAVARGIKKAGVPRNELFITSKIWNTSHRPELVAPALDDILEELQLDYLDLVLIHWPVAFVPEGDPHKNLFPKEKKGDKEVVKIDDSVSVVDTWKAFIKLLDTGKVKAIGVSNFSTDAIDKLIAETGVTPAVHQIERHPQLVQPELIEHHKKKGIHITAYSPLGSSTLKLFDNDQVKKIAERVGATPAQVLIAWGAVGGHSVIPKSVTPSRIASNFKQIELPQDAYDELSQLGGGKHVRFNVPITYKPSWPINVFDEEEEKGAPHSVQL